MASRSNFGLAPEPRDGERRERRDVHYGADESGARRLPTESGDETVARYRAFEARQRAREAEALDEEVELPGVSRNAGLLFGVGVGLGVAVLAVAGGLYLGGYVGRPVLSAGPETSLPEEFAQSAFDDAQNARALELARIAPVFIDERSARATPTQVNSPDIRVIDETAPATSAPPRATSDESTQSAPTMPDSSGLSNELEELQRSLAPRGRPVAPLREPSNSSAAPEPSVPPPAEPTAPAETSAPDSTNPY